MSVKLLLYCTKNKKRFRVSKHLYTYADDLYKLPNGQIKFGDSIELATYESNEYNQDNFLNGKIVAECECQKVEEVFLQGGEENLTFGTKSLFSIERKSCLDFEQLESYFGYNNDIWGYALHLSNVKVLNSPLKFEKDFIYKDYKSNELITKAPQNMCNVYDRFGNHYILISIRPEHLCKILNGEKTIEVRKKILNSLKEVKENA